MPETFLILLAGGVMLAAALSDPRAVTLNWLRLAGIIALCVGALAVFFHAQRETAAFLSPFYRRLQLGLVLAALLAVMAQLGFVQVAWRRTQRAFAAAAFVLAVLAGANILHGLMVPVGSAVRFPPKALSVALQTWSCAGAAAMTGLALMDMLLGHAYLTASRMTVAPFRRLTMALAVTIVVRAIVAVGGVLALDRWRPLEMLWGIHGLYILTRWLVGLGVPAAFVYMTHDCIRRRHTQAATGILYVTGVLVFIGEMIALYLVRETGLPF
jgi:hypothetical protein